MPAVITQFLWQIWQFIQPYLLYYVLGVSVGLIIMVLIWWILYARAGYHGALSLLMLIPLVNVVMVLLFIFREWPIQREVRLLRRQLAMKPYPLGSQFPTTQQYPTQVPNPNYPIATSNPQFPAQTSHPDYPPQYPSSR